ncbi:hypothetical protein LCGC14_0842690 [marine sediment metagenome]|uniref:Uncharacterized protein n=1 Tax=marine sediment metagenome TaxID=412755 RepID=A0A0F9PHD6_9ZZZZ|nr:hypothetical protein [archaeon]
MVNKLEGSFHYKTLSTSSNIFSPPMPMKSIFAALFDLVTTSFSYICLLETISFLNHVLMKKLTHQI